MTSPTPPVATDDAIEAEVRRLFGEVAAFLDDPELGPILRQAAKEGWDNTRLAGMLRQTNYWKSNADSNRKWRILYTLDPATAEQQRQATTVTVANIARDLGFNYTAEQQRYFAGLALANGWTTDQITEHLRGREANNAVQTGNLDTAVSISYGYLSAFLDEPEVGDLLRRAAREGWSPQRLEAELTGRRGGSRRRSSSAVDGDG